MNHPCLPCKHRTDWQGKRKRAGNRRSEGQVVSIKRNARPHHVEPRFRTAWDGRAVGHVLQRGMDAGLCESLQKTTEAAELDAALRRIDDFRRSKMAEDAFQLNVCR